MWTRATPEQLAAIFRALAGLPPPPPEPTVEELLGIPNAR